ncbi:MAG: protein-L-isoaspartate O-methyltransferase family protein [Gammaproteobacteria bacterium WSBS_2016_MAG_OTU1]
MKVDEQTRTNMIEQQIRPWDVLDETVLELYRTTVRDAFVADAAMGDLAYTDVSLPIGHGQTMLEPKLEARMLQALALLPTERVLHIGCGSGFFASLLGRLCAEVVTVEIIPELAAAAKLRLAPQKNIKVVIADGARGMSQEGMFDAVVLTGATPLIAPEFWDIIRTGGRLLAVVGEAPAMTLTKIEKREKDIYMRNDILETCLPLLQNAPAKAAFQF